MKAMRLSSLVAAVALTLGGLTASVVPASAQSIFASQGAARAAGVPVSNESAYQGGYTANVLRANDTGTGTGTGTDPTASTYTAIFGQIQGSTVALIAGVGALAFGVYILGLGYGVAWRLTGKSVKSIAK